MLIEKLPLIVLHTSPVLPGLASDIDTSRSKDIKPAIKEALLNDGLVAVAIIKTPPKGVVSIENIYDAGTVCSVENIGANKIRLIGQERIKLTNVELINGTLFGSFYENLSLKHEDMGEMIALSKAIAKQLEESFSKGMPQVQNELETALLTTEPEMLPDAIVHYLPLRTSVKVEVVASNSVIDRLKIVLNAIALENSISSIEDKIAEDLREKFDKSQREFYLREKLRAIKEELGEVGGTSDVDAIREEVQNNPYPQNVKEKLLTELSRYETIPSSSPESSIVRNYIDWVTKIPWWQSNVDNDDLDKVKTVLDKGHYGLEKVKERIVEYLAVKKMTNSLRSPILCLVGPPGVGKTSLAFSIAEAVERKFVKISLGGVTDESEIRGHRRTYLGSMPGRIIKGMKTAEVINPIFLLDEIDKMASDMRGDPTSAMLEVLDPEQNSKFSDNYIEEPYDLSNVMFIATANYIGNIPEALRDRLEIIQLSSYTEQEKLIIAKKHLIKESLKNHGLKASQFKIGSKEIMHIIRHYTKESGVRELSRYIDTLIRKTVVKILAGVEKVKIDMDLIIEMLGKARFDFSKSDKRPQVGVTTGLAYTQYGGDILPVEVTHFEGNGKFIITGQLGDVMKESATIALGYVKANAAKYGIDPTYIEKRNIHIHVPEGAVPKDGPSAGCTMITSIISALTNNPVKETVAMTGEVNLRGHVLPIGGLKEKAISAHRSGIKTIIIPKENEKDIDDIPEEVKKHLKIILSDNISVNLSEALTN